MKRKPDASQIIDRLSSLKTEAWLGPSRSYWPDFLFHFSDIHNIASALRDNKLYSRTIAVQTNKLGKDIASPEIIGKTPSKWYDYVRLYFRPRTPTQYLIEGIRTPAQLRKDRAHCPIPVFFLFNSREILTREDVQFSDSGLGSKYSHVHGSGAEFRKLPFIDIYSDGVYQVGPPDSWTISGRRNAEVIIRDELSLDGLVYVVCRSQAEFETLIHLAGLPVVRRFQGRIGVNPSLNLFYRKWAFVDSVDYLKRSELIRFNLNPSRIPTVLNATFQFHTTENVTHECKFTMQPAQSAVDINIGSIPNKRNGTVSLFIEDQMAYRNAYMAQTSQLLS